MPKSAGERIAEAVSKRKDLSYARLGRETGVPAGWIRSFATNQIHKGDAQRLKALADYLALDYRELLALTDQLSEVEALTGAEVAPPADMAALLARLDEQARVIDRLADAVAKLAASQATLAEGYGTALAELSAAREADRADASRAGAL